MRNDVIKKMFIDQYNLRNEDKVEVEFLFTDENGLSHFLIEDYQDYNGYTNISGYTTIRKTILKIGIFDQKTKNLN